MNAQQKNNQLLATAGAGPGLLSQIGMAGGAAVITVTFIHPIDVVKVSKFTTKTKRERQRKKINSPSTTPKKAHHHHAVAPCAVRQAYVLSFSLGGWPIAGIAVCESEVLGNNEIPYSTDFCIL